MGVLTTKLNTSQLNSGKEDDLRSPRTPTYVPSSANFFSLQPFDSATIFAPVGPSEVGRQVALPPPLPATPLAWVWQCHLCRSRYPLGATRRCLLDGHYYCCGESDRPNVKKKKKGQSCSSEFDYIGWRDISAWQRKCRKASATNPAHSPKGCENCEFPSHCRYGNRSLVGRSEVTTVAMTDVELNTAPSSKTSSSSASPPYGGSPRFYNKDEVTFESILADVKSEASKPVQSKVTDFYKPDRKKSKTKSSISTLAALEEIQKAAEKRKSNQPPTLSPIQEEFTKSGTDDHETSPSEIVEEYEMPVLDFSESDGSAYW